MVRSPSLASALVAVAAAPPCHARGFGASSFFVQTHLHRRYSRNNSGMSLSLLHHHPSSSFVSSSSSSSSRRWKSASINYVHNGDEKNEEHSNEPKTKKELDITQLNQKPQITPNFLDTILEIPDPKLFTGDLLFLLIVNFLLQIASEVSTSEFWLNGGFYQPIAMPSTTLLGVVVRDSKMSIAWILSALWNRSYAYSSVSNDETAVKVAIQDDLVPLTLLHHKKHNYTYITTYRRVTFIYLFLILSALVLSCPNITTLPCHQLIGRFISHTRDHTDKSIFFGYYFQHKHYFLFFQR